jgi:hypothetical protein
MRHQVTNFFYKSESASGMPKYRVYLTASNDFLSPDTPILTHIREMPRYAQIAFLTEASDRSAAEMKKQIQESKYETAPMLFNGPPHDGGNLPDHRAAGSALRSHGGWNDSACAR